MLVIRSQMGDESGFRESLELSGPRLLLFTQRMMRSWPEEVPDTVQEIRIAIYRGLLRLREVSKFRSWAFRIARDRIYREYRRRKLPVQPLDEAQLVDLPEIGDPRAAVERAKTDSAAGQPASADDVKRINGLLANEIQMTEIVSISTSVVATAVGVLGLGTLVLRTVVILNLRATLNQVNASLAEISNQLRAMRNVPAAGSAGTMARNEPS
jgi:DNA-directed RNA polymerase specialized sigma24 family protein